MNGIACLRFLFCGDDMFEIGFVAATTFFAVIGPLDVTAMFAALTAGKPGRYRRTMARRGVLVAALILLLFGLSGELLLNSLGISLAALRAGGGVLLLLIGIDMVFRKASGASGTTDEEAEEAAAKDDISVFPIATPLIAGPGAMGAVILLMAEQQGHVEGQLIVLGAMLLVLVLTYLALVLSGGLTRLVGITAMHVVSRVFGVLLSALAVQFIFDGVLESGLIRAG